MAIRSDQQRAHASKTTHSFHPGDGYVEHEAHEALPRGPHVGKKCEPDAPAKNGSTHLLWVPGKHKMLAFAWVAAEQAWERRGGRRMAFTAAHLGEHGWTYGQPVYDQETSSSPAHTTEREEDRARRAGMQ